MTIWLSCVCQIKVMKSHRKCCISANTLSIFVKSIAQRQENDNCLFSSFRDNLNVLNNHVFFHRLEVSFVNLVNV